MLLSCRLCYKCPVFLPERRIFAEGTEIGPLWVLNPKHHDCRRVSSSTKTPTAVVFLTVTDACPGADCRLRDVSMSLLASANGGMRSACSEDSEKGGGKRMTLAQYNDFSESFRCDCEIIYNEKWAANIFSISNESCFPPASCFPRELQLFVIQERDKTYGKYCPSK